MAAGARAPAGARGSSDAGRAEPLGAAACVERDGPPADAAGASGVGSEAPATDDADGTGSGSDGPIRTPARRGHATPTMNPTAAMIPIVLHEGPSASDEGTSISGEAAPRGTIQRRVITPPLRNAKTWRRSPAVRLRARSLGPYDVVDEECDGSVPGCLRRPVEGNVLPGGI